MIENVVVTDSDWIDTDMEIVFGGEDYTFVSATDMPGLLKEIGVYPSTSKARAAGRTGKIPSGFTDNYKASKKRRLWIWNPE
jgi:hypothetical protein